MNMGEFRGLTADVPDSAELYVVDNEMFASYPATATVDLPNGQVEIDRA
jgi:hypothetical protein